MASDGFDPKVLRDTYDAIAPEYAAKFGGDLDQLGLDRALPPRPWTATAARACFC
jgi:hypothetical protein